MRITAILALVLMLAGLSFAAPFPEDKDKEKANVGRLLTGKVLDNHDNADVDAVVYLNNTRTHEVKTYIVGPDGTFHFPELSPNTDYEVYAQYKGVKSETRTVSQFDDRKSVNLILRIDAK